MSALWFTKGDDRHPSSPPSLADRGERATVAPKGWLQSILELHLVVGDTRRGLRVGFEEMENGLAVASVIWWPVWPLGGLSQNEIGRARISMMARSDLLHAGPDTEAQDQSYHSADSACNARPVHTNGSQADMCTLMPPTRRAGSSPPSDSACRNPR